MIFRQCIFCVLVQTTKLHDYRVQTCPNLLRQRRLQFFICLWSDLRLLWTSEPEEGAAHTQRHKLLPLTQLRWSCTRWYLPLPWDLIAAHRTRRKVTIWQQILLVWVHTTKFHIYGVTIKLYTLVLTWDLIVTHRTRLVKQAKLGHVMQKQKQTPNQWPSEISGQ